jgi:HlyD family secretion protein
VNNALLIPTPITVDVGNPREEIRLGAIIAAAFFVIFLGWAALMPLDAGVSAPGTIAVSGNRQTVQQRDGGVITAINVREGQHVTKGQVLVELAAPELRAAERALTSDYLLALAQRARLMAERAGQTDFAPPAEFASLKPEDQPIAAQVLEMQHSEMRARAQALSAQQSVLNERGQQLYQQQSGYARQRGTIIEQQRLINEQLKGLKEIAAKGFASMNRVRDLERQEAELRGQQAAMEAE